MLDPRTPVIVGAASLSERLLGAEPIDLMARSVEAALADAQGVGLRERIEAIRVVWGVWPYRDPGQLVGQRIGASAARTTLTSVGGNQVYDLIIDSATRIARGDLDVAVICAAETLRSRRRDRAAGTTSTYLPEPDGAVPDETFGDTTPLSSAEEVAFGVDRPTTFYAMAETRIRHRRGESIDDHRRRIAALWCEASTVALRNPSAWSNSVVSAPEIATESEHNRPIASPYPKLMTANLDVDQGGAVVLCSAATAAAAGVPRDRWVFPWAGANANDQWYPTNRWAFDESPAIRIAGRRALELAGLEIDECEMLDLYSCFPSAVQVAQHELSIDEARPFTITGGLTFAAGPLNCYCILATARAVELLRHAPGDHAFLTGNGGYFTKHSMFVLAARPPQSGYRAENVQHEVDRLPRRQTPRIRPSKAELETYTVVYDRAGAPSRAIAACLDESGQRHWATTSAADHMTILLGDDKCGVEVRLAGEAFELT